MQDPTPALLSALQAGYTATELHQLVDRAVANMTQLQPEPEPETLPSPLPSDLLQPQTQLQPEDPASHVALDSLQGHLPGSEPSSLSLQGGAQLSLPEASAAVPGANDKASPPATAADTTRVVAEPIHKTGGESRLVSPFEDPVATQDLEASRPAQRDLKSIEEDAAQELASPLAQSFQAAVENDPLTVGHTSMADSSNEGLEASMQAGPMQQDLASPVEQMPPPDKGKPSTAELTKSIEY